MKPRPLDIVKELTALKIEALRTFVDEKDKIKRNAGDEWLFEGPATYYPRIEERVVCTVNAVIIGE